MNPNADQQAVPPPPPPQPHRSSFSCDRHPTEQFTGFCPSCLCERLTTLDISANNAASSSRRPSNALKSIFRANPGGIKQNQNLTQQCQPPEQLLQLRRTQSFSASKNNEGFSGVFEPQRHSCDVRGRSTLWSLFNLDDSNKNTNNKNNDNNRKSSASITEQLVHHSGPVIESKEEEEGLDEEDNYYEPDTQQLDDEVECKACTDSENGDEIRVCHEPNINMNINNNTFSNFVVEEVEKEEEEDVKRIKDHIDLDSLSQVKKPSVKESLWSAASVFSKKWQNWRRKQKLKKQHSISLRNNSRSSMMGGPTLPVEKPISRQLRETQSEIADYGFGRRSCDTEPRFSLDAARISFDAARMSVDDVRPSFDEPRVSWDGYLIGGSRGNFSRLPPMLSVVEDSPAAIHVARSDMQIPVEEEDEKVVVPGGSAQTKEYYSDSSRRKKSLDRSNSIRKTAAAVVAEMDEVAAQTAFNANNVECNRISVDSNSLRDDCSETFELGFRDNGTVIGNGVERKGLKKSRRWKNIWGLIIRRTKDEDGEERYNNRGGNGVERSLSESWQELRRERNGEAMRGGLFTRNVFRSNSSVSWRNSNYSNGGSFGGVRKMSSSSFETNGGKKRDDFVLERNRSARYSPNHVDSGLLRFYLTPLRSSCRRGGGGISGKNRTNNSHSIARSVLGMY